ncbi:C40 family peptidase [Halobacillus faecis]|uniref:Gamma-D-glutamyl-L-lysine endopeptidase n=1 Tax=Halobacillus faecis TaxID=360184 RepID=A0A511WPP4_9BACI|nr:C40 family peptidase [Halobacillus faecis]GEN52471.1 gamma-D-glutamyl-L-lysine endopeptidase [Halobacillus faecis]
MTQTKENPEKRVVRVPVATLWTASDSPRAVDQTSLTASASMRDWLKVLNDDQKRELCDENLVQSQLLLGEEVWVEEWGDDWAKVVVPSQPSKKDKRGYPGYIPGSQLVEKREDEWKANKQAIVHKKQAWLYNGAEEPLMEVSYLTSLPVIEENDTFVKVLSPDGAGYFLSEDVAVQTKEETTGKGNGEDLIRSGEAFVGLPYFWGGMSAFGYDCSGFAYNMHKAFHYEIPRDATDQAKSGMNVPLDDLQVGDLLFFAYEEGKGSIHHVGFYYGDNKMLHSPNVGKSIEIIDLEGTVYEKELCVARRYWNEMEETS